MRFDDNASPGFVAPPTFRQVIYNPSIASSASVSSVSLWSDAPSNASDTSSQTSDEIQVSGNSSDNDSTYSYSLARKRSNEDLCSRRGVPPVPAELRRNPRRTSVNSNSRVCPPSLVRQSDRKVNFVDSLVDSSTLIVDAIWPTSSTVCRTDLGSKAVLPLRTFIQETLRRSRTSYSTLQVALYYLILIKPHVPNRNFTMEQVDDRHSTQALQCGRRMFLAALILASKYLQDRNYSARAWSKISGLNTQEINQNEMAFLQAVHWKLHIADSVFQRWTDIVLKYTPPPSPPSPGGSPQLSTPQHEDWRQIILGLNSDLTNVEDLIRPPYIGGGKAGDLSPLSLRNIVTMPNSTETLSSSPTSSTPILMEPRSMMQFTPRRSTGSMLPTPRLTPQTSGLSTPAAGSLPSSQSRGGSMGFAMAQASTLNAAQYLDRPPVSMSTSPQSFSFSRRSSLANSMSTASSPESMISDTSRTSRSSSISSVSSHVSATMHSKLSAPSRFRCAKLGQEKNSRLTIPSVPEDYDAPCFSSSPSSYTGPTEKAADEWSTEVALAGRKRQLDDMASEAASDAARTLQALHSYRGMSTAGSSLSSRRESTGTQLQDNVRDLLNSHSHAGSTSWRGKSLLRSRAYVSEPHMQSHHVPEFSERKRVCCSTEAASGYQLPNVHLSIGIRGPGMWQGILN